MNNYDIWKLDTPSHYDDDQEYYEEKSEFYCKCEVSMDGFLLELKTLMDKYGVKDDESKL